MANQSGPSTVDLINDGLDSKTRLRCSRKGAGLRVIGEIEDRGNKSQGVIKVARPIVAYRVALDPFHQCIAVQQVDSDWLWHLAKAIGPKKLERPPLDPLPVARIAFLLWVSF